MSVRDEIMALPPDERLPYALELLDQAYGPPSLDRLRWARRTFGLPTTEARMFLALNSAAPRMLTRERLHGLTVGGDEAVSPNLVSVYIARIRKALTSNGGPQIETIWGQGYRIANPVQEVEIKADGPAKVKEPWTEDDDADLLRMVESGSSTAAMAYELDRTVSGVKQRLGVLGVRRSA